MAHTQVLQFAVATKVVINRVGSALTVRTVSCKNSGQRPAAGATKLPAGCGLRCRRSAIITRFSNPTTGQVLIISFLRWHTTQIVCRRWSSLYISVTLFTQPFAHFHVDLVHVLSAPFYTSSLRISFNYYSLQKSYNFLSFRKNTRLFFVYIGCLVSRPRRRADSGHANRLIATAEKTP